MTHFTGLWLERFGETTKLNESGSQKSGSLGGYKSCQQAKHAKLCSDLLQAPKEGTLDSPGLPPGGVGGGGLNFCVRGTPTQD